MACRMYNFSRDAQLQATADTSCCTVNFDLETLKYVLLLYCHGMPIWKFNFFREQHLFFFWSSVKQVAKLRTAV
jgi:hypothetical protein